MDVQLLMRDQARPNISNFFVTFKVKAMTKSGFSFQVMCNFFNLRRICPQVEETNCFVVLISESYLENLSCKEFERKYKSGIYKTAYMHHV